MRTQLLWILLALIGNNAHAQWLNYPAPGTPRTGDGKADLTAPAPRAANGAPDLSGVWHVQTTPPEEMKRIFGNDVDKTAVPGMGPSFVSKYATNIFSDVKPEDVPERPEAAQVRRQRLQSGIRDNPSLHCLPHGIPLASLLAEVSKVVQTPGLTIILYEADNTHRQIYTDGRKLPDDPQPAWLGYSVGRWEHDTLVVETAGFNDKSWVDLSGHSHSDALRVTERYHRRDFGHLDVEMTFDDPKMYTKPFTIKVTHLLQADSDILEFFCNENEKDRVHLVP